MVYGKASYRVIGIKRDGGALAPNVVDPGLSTPCLYETSNTRTRIMERCRGRELDTRTYGRWERVVLKCHLEDSGGVSSVINHTDLETFLSNSIYTYMKGNTVLLRRPDLSLGWGTPAREHSRVTVLRRILITVCGDK